MNLLEHLQDMDTDQLADMSDAIDEVVREQTASKPMTLPHLALCFLNTHTMLAAVADERTIEEGTGIDAAYALEVLTLWEQVIAVQRMIWQARAAANEEAEQ